MVKIVALYATHAKVSKIVYLCYKQCGETGRQSPVFPSPARNFRGWGGDRDRFLKNFGDILETGMTSISGFFGVLPSKIPENFLGLFGDGDDFIFRFFWGFIPIIPEKFLVIVWGRG